MLPLACKSASAACSLPHWRFASSTSASSFGADVMVISGWQVPPEPLHSMAAVIACWQP